MMPLRSHPCEMTPGNRLLKDGIAALCDSYCGETKAMQKLVGAPIF